jgi:two-component system, sensor histidine kinase and response regulator
MRSASPLATTSETIPNVRFGKPTILVVDDEEGPRQSLKIVFKDEYNILLASNGPAALELARKHQIDVAILDILMAGMSGIEVLEKLKEINPTIEVIMLTAYETIDTARQAIRHGACDYLNKPFDIPTMRAAVSRAAEKHRVSLDLQSTNQQLETLQQEITDQKMQEEMVRTKGEIYASVLHDINGPLTVISGHIEMINSSIQDARSVDGEKLELIKDDLNKLTGQVGRCFEISRRYLSFLREKPADSSMVGVNQILTDLKELLIRHPSTRGHHLAIHPLPEDLHAEINGTDLLQILLNLTANALQCTEQPHRVEVRAQRLLYPLDLSSFQESAEERIINREGFLNRAPLVAISIQDNGPGIPPEIVPNMFDTKFTTKPAGKGTGLGLSIVKRLIKQANGAIRLATKPGRGTTFTVCLQTRDSR